MSIRDRLSKLFSGGRAEDEAAEREEYHLGEPADAELERERFRTPFPGAETAESGERDDEFRPPREPGE